MASKEDLLRDMQKCFINLKVEEDKKETVTQREREDSIDIRCTEFPDFSEDFRQIIKAGWLEKTPPKGGKIYQRRWVQLDSEYLRYFQYIKEVYSKKMVSLESVDKVVSVGDLRFEVHSQSRTFLFRAESTQERNDWVGCFEKILSDRKNSLGPRNLFFKNGSVNICFEGNLEMLSPRTKVYMLISRDKLFLFRSHEEYIQGVGITDIDMRMANVREGENKCSFTLTTPYRAFSFVVKSVSEKQKWCELLNECVSRSLSCDGVCESIWRVPSNRLCADCSSSMPEWASINLCVLLCEKCAGVHRSLGQNMSKVRSLKLDERVWTDDLIRVFLLLGNGKANQFWGANIPQSESLSANANSEQRLQHITAKYKNGKYRKYHILFGQQEALNRALCSAVQFADLLDTLSLLNCGADIKCNTGIPEFPSPLSLAKHSGQTVQAELLMQNLNSESFTPVVKDVSIRSYSGYLFKIASSARPITDHKTKADFSQRWCCLGDGMFSYFKSEQSHNKCGGMKTSEIICLSVNNPGKHCYEHTFELYSEEGKVYLFGTDDGSIAKNWIRAIAMAMLPPALFDVCGTCDRLGRLRCTEGSHGIGWFCLSGFKLHVLLEDNVQTIDLRKLVTLTLSDSDGSLAMVWRGGPLHLLADRRPHFVGWQTYIQQKSGAGDQPLSQQQLTELGVPVTIDRCLDHVTRYGLLSSGIYRESGINSHVTKLLERFKNDARSVTWCESEYSVHVVANTLKRFLREVKDGLLNGQENSDSWLRAAGLENRSEKINRYKILLSNLPDVNRETLRVLIHHLVCVQHLSDENQMTVRNLGIMFGPSLFQRDGKDTTAFQVVEELIQNYCSIFNVSESDLQRQLNMTSVILNKHKSQKSLSRTPSSTICAVYLEKKEEVAGVLVQVAADMTVFKLVSVVLELKGIQQANEEFWSCYEVLEKEDMARTLHYQERVLPLYFSLGRHCHLLIKRNQYIISIMRYLENKVNLCKSGPLRVCEVKGESSRNFHLRHCELSGNTFRLHKELQGSQCEREYPAKELKLYHGCRSKLHPPTPWGLMLIHDKQQWYLCCENEDELTEWTATFYSIQYNGDIWPSW
ncbi:arf-GAP with Rho-GAP domain, ANK repeat and PH domain-containing protein 1 isoform X1 [Rhinichthys klamathensis goyatoka]|uniref:arf-GAP with Rho-GAP domain, ANK repeat and PH domain-containing protein 1 isoform X1 n=1 Tax=Rhinichthys klamathensis goyatoka TaxID=3034132 RepID=UPI0024B539B6|nr:arf-GAP with Rho-GAP domain, ANK repeat and PH domain-containing protein 1 isoform X1 [Rhinichthys klamathensis goyatoka]